MRTFKEECAFIERVSPYCLKIQPGFVPNMQVPAYLFVNDHLQALVFDELKQYVESQGVGGFIPALKQVANVATLPGILDKSVALPDVHSGYGFAIGNVAAFDMTHPDAIVSPGGVGFDINCGVRLLRTNLREEDVAPVKEELVDAMFKGIPVGVGTRSPWPITPEDLDEILMTGVHWAERQGYTMPLDVDHCEERGCMRDADASKVSARAKARGLDQVGTLGAGNHYAEIQVVDEIYDVEAAKVMGITERGQVCVMIHCGSRGLGHQVATDALQRMEQQQQPLDMVLNDRQLSCARIQSPEGQDYLKGMAAAANYAWVNRQMITHQTRRLFAKVFHCSVEDLGMELVYDVSHNIAKVEQHQVSATGEWRPALVHRKGSTRAFPPHHPDLPQDYQAIGQPVLVGGTMGTFSYVLVGTQEGMQQTFGSTCHGAGRAQSRNAARKQLKPQDVFDELKAKGVSIRIASPKFVVEEAPDSYKDVTQVVETCDRAGLSRLCVKLRPIAVIKG